MTTRKKRVRWTLLLLLWVWAACIFTTLDLFKNVREFDSIRPRAPLYRGMRIAAHKLIGEPLPEEARGPPRTLGLAERLARVRGLDDRQALRGFAADADDPRLRIAALRELALRFRDREALLAAARDREEIMKVRKQAARFVGWTGPGASRALEALLESQPPGGVRAGVLVGFGELGTPYAAERLLGLTPAPAAVEGLARIANAEAAPVLHGAVLDVRRAADTRAAICRALARIREPATARVLMDVLRDESNPPAVRATAARSLGRLGRTEALPVVMAARSDAAPDVARHARLAATRLTHMDQRR